MPLSAAQHSASGAASSRALPAHFCRWESKSNAAAAARIPDIRCDRSILHEIDDCIWDINAVDPFKTSDCCVRFATATKTARAGFGHHRILCRR